MSRRKGAVSELAVCQGKALQTFFFQTELNKIRLDSTLLFPAHIMDKWGAMVKVKQESYFQNLFPKLKDSGS